MQKNLPIHLVVAVGSRMVMTVMTRGLRTVNTDCHGKCAMRLRKGATYPESASRSPTALLGRKGEGCSAVLLGPGVPLRIKTLAPGFALNARGGGRNPPPNPKPPLLKKLLSASSEREARCATTLARVFS